MYGFTAGDEGLWRCADGLNWEDASQGLGPARMRGMMESRAGRLYAWLDPEGIFWSDDGTSWHQLEGHPEGLRFWDLMEVPDGGLVAATQEGVYRSQDGSAWQALPGWPTDSAAYQLATVPGGHIYTYTAAGVFRLNDLDVWEAVNRGLPDLTWPEMAVSETGRLYAASGTQVYRLAEGGAWEPASPDLGEGIRELLVVSGSDTIYASAYGLPYRSTGGSEWELVSSEFGSDVILLSADGEGRLCLGTRVALFCSDDGNLWDEVTEVEGYATSLVRAGDGTVYVSTISARDFPYFHEGGILRATDYAHWTSVEDPSLGPDVFALAAGHDGTVYAGVLYGGVLKSDDGLAWEPMNEGLTSHVVLDLLVDNDGALYAATHGGGVLRSANGHTWEPINEGLTSHLARGLAGDGEGVLYVVRDDDRVFRSADGRSWEPAGTSLGDAPELDNVAQAWMLLHWPAVQDPETVASCSGGGYVWAPYLGQLWLSKDAATWLPAVSLPEESPMAVDIKDKTLVVWSLSQSQELLRAETSLPSAWRLPAPYLTFFGWAWRTFHWLAYDPKPAFLAVGLSIALIAALEVEARRARVRHRREET
jgi:hypothetical protein